MKRRRRRSSQEFTFRPGKRRFNKRKFFRSFFNWCILVLVAAIFGYAFVTFGYQTVNVIGPSMTDTYVDGDMVLINKINYKFKSVKRFDVVAYKKVDSTDYYDIKRVIGLPEETVLIKDGMLYINGEPLQNLPFDEKILTAGIAGDEITLGKDEYFVMGDNVNNSEDSRYINVGNISSSEIIGKVVKKLKN